MKKLWMTNGTYDYLAKLQIEHSDLVIVQDGDQSLAIMEGEKQDLFSEAREYEVIGEAGKLAPRGFFVLNHIPVTYEGRPLFESRFKNRARSIENEPGIEAIR